MKYISFPTIFMITVPAFANLFQQGEIAPALLRRENDGDLDRKLSSYTTGAYRIYGSNPNLQLINANYKHSGFLIANKDQKMIFQEFTTGTNDFNNDFLVFDGNKNSSTFQKASFRGIVSVESKIEVVSDEPEVLFKDNNGHGFKISKNGSDLFFYHGMGSDLSKKILTLHVDAEHYEDANYAKFFGNVVVEDEKPGIELRDTSAPYETPMGSEYDFKIYADGNRLIFARKKISLDSSNYGFDWVEIMSVNEKGLTVRGDTQSLRYLASKGQEVEAPFGKVTKSDFSVKEGVGVTRVTFAEAINIPYAVHLTACTNSHIKVFNPNYFSPDTNGFSINLGAHPDNLDHVFYKVHLLK